VETSKTRTKEEKEQNRAAKTRETIIFCALGLVFEALMIILYALWLKYEDDEVLKSKRHSLYFLSG